MVGSVAVKELVQCKLTVSPTQTPSYYFSTYKSPSSIRSNLADGQTQKISQLTVQYRQRKSKPGGKHGILHTDVSCPPRVTSFVLPRETDWDMLCDLVPGTDRKSVV